MADEFSDSDSGLDDASQDATNDVGAEDLDQDLGTEIAEDGATSPDSPEDDEELADASVEGEEGPADDEEDGAASSEAEGDGRQDGIPPEGKKWQGVLTRRSQDLASRRDELDQREEDLRTREGRLLAAEAGRGRDRGRRREEHDDADDAFSFDEGSDDDRGDRGRSRDPLASTVRDIQRRLDARDQRDQVTERARADQQRYDAYVEELDALLEAHDLPVDESTRAQVMGLHMAPANSRASTEQIVRKVASDRRKSSKKKPPVTQESKGRNRPGRRTRNTLPGSGRSASLGTRRTAPPPLGSPESMAENVAHFEAAEAAEQ